MSASHDLHTATSTQDILHQDIPGAFVSKFMKIRLKYLLFNTETYKLTIHTSIYREAPKHM